MARYPLTETECRRGELVWLLEVEFAEQTFRWASREIVIVDDDGNDVLYRGGLSISASRSLELFSLTPNDPAVSIFGVYLPAEIDIAEMVERGFRLSGAPAELSRWVTGRTYEQRDVYLAGRVRMPDYGAADEPIAFTIRPEGLLAGEQIPDSEAIITAVTWTASPRGNRRKYYPVVIGAPGFEPGAAVGCEGGSPAYLVDTANDYVLVADGWVYNVGTATVNLINVTQNSESGALTTVAGTDAQSRPVTYVDAAAAYGGGWADEDEIWARWDESTGGTPNDTRTDCLEGGGDIIVHMLRRAGVPVDYDAFRAVADELNAYIFAGYIDEPIGALEWLQQHILPLMPVSLLYGGDGIYPVVWRRRVRAEGAVAALTAGTGQALSRAGAVRVEDGRFGNNHRIHYAPRSDNDKFWGRKVLTGRDVGADYDRVQPASHLRASRLLYGGVPMDTVRALYVYDDATAALVLAWRSMAYAFPWRLVTYDNPACEWAWLEPGDVVTITDSELHWSSRLCWVHAVTWDDTTPTLELVLIDDPARDAAPL